MTTQERRWVLSGGMGSGKSSVGRLLAAQGVKTLDADSVGHEILEPDGPAFPAVARTWPEVVTDGHIDRGMLARIVFQDSPELRRLEGITHPHIFGIISERLNESGADPVVVEVPLLRHGLSGDWRRLIVDCDDVTRLERALTKGLDEADAKARMASQPRRGEWLAIADLVVPNHGTMEELERTVGALVGHL